MEKMQPKARFRDKHIFVPEHTYSKTDDELIINNLLDFTNSHIRSGSEFLSAFGQWAATDRQNIASNRIEYGQMVGYHSHDFYEICFVFEHKVYHYINEDIVILQKGDILILHPEISHSLYPNPCARASNILITKKYAEELSRTLSSFFSDNSFSFVVNKKAYVILHTENEELEKLASSLLHFPYLELRHNKMLNFYLESVFNQFMSRLFVEETEGRAVTVANGISSKYNNQIDEILNYINTNYAVVDADTVCRRFHYSRMQLYRLLKKHTGLSFIDYISDLRFRHAINMLSTTNMSVKKIAEHIGLEENYFYRFFYGYKGMTPREYRLSQKKEDI